MLPAWSVAVYVTAVVPTVKVAPGVCVDVSVATQLSVAVGAVHVATAVLQASPPVACNVMFAGQPEMTGLLVSATTTLNVHEEVLPAASVAVYVTAVVPKENVAPGAWLDVTVAVQLSVTVGAVHVATAVLHPVPDGATVMLAGQAVNTGVDVSETITLNAQVCWLPA
jgi:hypothetical protein